MKEIDPFLELPGSHEIADLPRDLIAINATGSQLVEDFGVWTPTVHLLRRIGASDVYLMGEGLGVTFEKFKLETQVYPTNTVVALSKASGDFKLSEGMKERMAFTLFLLLGGRGTCDLTCGPIPECSRDLVPIMLARNYACALAALLSKHPNLLSIPPKTDIQQIENTLLRLLA